MAEKLSDGTMSWIGGMDTSRSPIDIDDLQYSKGINTIIGSDHSGIRSRYGFENININFENKNTKRIYETGHIQGEGYFISSGRIILIVVVDGYILKLTQSGYASFDCVNLNLNDRNSVILSKAWVIPIPNGCIVNNGYNLPVYITANTQRRTNPNNGEIGVGFMGVYCQNRLFYVDSSQRLIVASDYRNPITIQEYYDTGIIGFAAPDSDEIITAIAKQKTILNYVEGGNLIFSTNRDIYSVDVRDTRDTWADLSTRIGKVQETIPGFSAVSSYSFEPFNSNIYFRTAQYGICSLRQTEFQFTGVDALTDQSIEAKYFLDRDTDWLLNSCYTKSFNERLLTTVTPERTEEGYTFWNGILSFHPAAVYQNQQTIPRRFESIWTGVQPWCLTVVKRESSRDVLYVHSRDRDGINRLYMMNEQIDYDLNHRGKIVEIKGMFETRAYNFKNPFSIKKINNRFYRLGKIERNVKINVYSRSTDDGEWVLFYDNEHLVDRSMEINGNFAPSDKKGQTREYVNMSEEVKSCCNNSTGHIHYQYRFEFEGPINFKHFVVIATQEPYDATATPRETTEFVSRYSDLPIYTYSIA